MNDFLNTIKLLPIAIVKNSRKEPIDDNWETIIAEIELEEHIPTKAFDCLSEFTLLEIIRYFDKVNDEDIIFSGRPRGNPKNPDVGIFGQRKKDRPNKLGIATVELLEYKGKTIKVKFLDAIDGTLVLDINPVFNEFEPKKEIKQPIWFQIL